MVIPTTDTPVPLAIARMGPPTPHPASSTVMPGLALICSAMRSSWRMMDASKLSPLLRGAK
jgi:hypothetical protein